MQTGSCLCGSVRYEIAGDLGEMGHCHCTMCRKGHGAAFATYAAVAWDQFTITAGEGYIQSYQSSPGITRTFCRQCGANLQFIPEGRSRFGIAVGTLDSDPGVKASYEIWTSARAPWWDPHQALESHETEPGATSE